MRRRRSVRGASLLALAVFATLIVHGRHADAGPWVAAPGHGYAKLWMRWLAGSGYHDGEGRGQSLPLYHELTFSGYAELSVAERLGLWLHAPMLQSFFLRDPRSGRIGSHVTVGDPQLGLRVAALRRGRLALAVEAGVRFPLAPAREVQEVYSTEEGMPRLGDLRIGAGVWDVQWGLALGYSWRRFYAAGSAGYLLRTRGYAHAALWTAEGGVSFLRPFAVRARLTGRHPLPVGDAPLSESPSGVGNGTSYVGLALEGDWRFTSHLALVASLEGGLGAVRRQAGGPVISLGVAASW
ncbi:MAG: hypothetical protein IT371_21180 [Deltaproteobacteria bacterium]|nr:hypothetical protein [Deltaproteobacteria bacterium]